MTRGSFSVASTGPVAALRLDVHGAELEDRERLAVPPDAGLAVDHGTARRDADRERDEQHHRDRRHEEDRRQRGVEQPLGHAARPARHVVEHLDQRDVVQAQGLAAADQDLEGRRHHRDARADPGQRLNESRRRSCQDGSEAMITSSMACFTHSAGRSSRVPSTGTDSSARDLVPFEPLTATPTMSIPSQLLPADGRRSPRRRWRWYRPPARAGADSRRAAPSSRGARRSGAPRSAPRRRRRSSAGRRGPGGRSRPRSGPAPAAGSGDDRRRAWARGR